MTDETRQPDEGPRRSGRVNSNRPLRREVARKVFWKRLAAGAIAVAGAAVTLLAKRRRR